jgi:hypothetical protein
VAARAWVGLYLEPKITNFEFDVRACGKRWIGKWSASSLSTSSSCSDALREARERLDGDCSSSRNPVIKPRGSRDLSTHDGRTESSIAYQLGREPLKRARRRSMPRGVANLWRSGNPSFARVSRRTPSCLTRCPYGRTMNLQRIATRLEFPDKSPKKCLSSGIRGLTIVQGSEQTEKEKRYAALFCQETQGGAGGAS